MHKFEFDDNSADSEETACILMAFKSMQPHHDPELIAHWKTWTGECYSDNPNTGNPRAPWLIMKCNPVPLIYNNGLL